MLPAVIAGSAHEPQFRAALVAVQLRSAMDHQLEATFVVETTTTK